MSAVRFLTVGDTTKFSLTSDRHGYKNMISRPHATLFIIDPSNPLRTLEIRGTVQSSPDADLGPFKAANLRIRRRTSPQCRRKNSSARVEINEEHRE